MSSEIVEAMEQLQVNQVNQVGQDTEMSSETPSRSASPRPPPPPPSPASSAKSTSLASTQKPGQKATTSPRSKKKRKPRARLWKRFDLPRYCYFCNQTERVKAYDHISTNCAAHKEFLRKQWAESRAAMPAAKQQSGQVRVIHLHIH